MVTLEQIKDLRQRLSTLEACLDIAGKRKEVEAKTQEIAMKTAEKLADLVKNL